MYANASIKSSCTCGLGNWNSSSKNSTFQSPCLIVIPPCSKRPCNAATIRSVFFLLPCVSSSTLKNLPRRFIMSVRGDIIACLAIPFSIPTAAGSYLSTALKIFSAVSSNVHLPYIMSSTNQPSSLTLTQAIEVLSNLLFFFFLPTSSKPAISIVR